MTAVAVLLGYAACAAWGAPALLVPLTRRGASVRAGLAAWLLAMASVLVSASVALAFSVRTVAADWPRLTQDLCRSVAGAACTPQVYGSTLYQVGVAVLAAALTMASAVALWHYGRRVRLSRAQTRLHARTALLVGHALAGTAASGSGPAPWPPPALGAARSAKSARTVMLDDPRPAAYCAAGRPAAIVITSGALAVLDPPQLRAVLAHEHAHLAQGHHALATVVRGLTAAFPGIPLFTQGAAEIGRLAEMSADDTAARASSRATVATALLALATGRAVPGALAAAPAVARPRPQAALAAAPAVARPRPRTALAAAADAVPARVDRLLAPARPGAARVIAAALAAFSALVVLAPAALPALVR